MTGELFPEITVVRNKRRARLEDYEGFVEKFKPKLTTDDCYTPAPVYEAVLNWVCKRYGIDPALVVRPFYPGGDYENFDYPENCAVIDNPPFSILSKIKSFYLERGIRFFLFAPTLTLFSGYRKGVCHISAHADIIYANGANVNTSFCSNMEKGIAAMTAPGLRRVILEAQNTPAKPKPPSYDYPANIITAAMTGKYVERGFEITVPEDECEFVRTLDEQIPLGKNIFGGGFIVSDRVKEKRMGLEKLIRETRDERFAFSLSERERDIVRRLSGGGD